MGCGASKGENGGAVDGGISHLKKSGVHNQEPRSKQVIEKRIECIDEVQTCFMGGSKVRFAYVSQRGYYPDDLNKANQDSYSVTHNFASREHDAFLGVYDGHGKVGDKCSQYARDYLPQILAKQLEHERLREAKIRRFQSRSGTEGEEEESITSASIDLTKEQIHNACLKAHVKCNKALNLDETVDDALSGTTSISVYFHNPGNRITICNVGDSRAILGQRKKMAYRALPLSRDQTPYRRDERIRVKKCGARVLSLDQIEGLEPCDDDDMWEDDLNLGEEIDEWGDPPRVWHPEGEYPGTAFTRSFGDSIAEELGVFAEPEMITKELSPDDAIIVIASDGVFEFLTNQSVIDICAKFQNPLDACRAVVAEAYELWLQYELRTDDITIICVFVDGLADIPAPVPTTPEEVRANMIRKESEKNLLDQPDDELPSDAAKPIRSKKSKQFNSLIRKVSLRSLTDEDLDKVDISGYATEKTEEQKVRIGNVIKGHLMFQNVSENQREMIYAQLKKQDVTKGEWIIKQGEVGDYFYIIDNGSFEVRVLPENKVSEGMKPGEGNDGGDVVHVYHSSHGSHPSFGELALMHSIPRAASIIALTDGTLWSLHRIIFKKILMEKSDRRELYQALQKKVPGLKCLRRSDIEALSNLAEEVLYNEGDVVVTKGDMGSCFYFIVHGECVQKETNEELMENDYFGEDVLLDPNPYKYTVTAKCTTKCFKLSLAMIQELVEDLEERRQKYEMRRSSTESALRKSRDSSGCGHASS